MATVPMSRKCAGHRDASGRVLAAERSCWMPTRKDASWVSGQPARPALGPVEEHDTVGPTARVPGKRMPLDTDSARALRHEPMHLVRLLRTVPDTTPGIEHGGLEPLMSRSTVSYRRSAVLAARRVSKAIDSRRHSDTAWCRSPADHGNAEADACGQRDEESIARRDTHPGSTRR